MGQSSNSATHIHKLSFLKQALPQADIFAFIKYSRNMYKSLMSVLVLAALSEAYKLPGTAPQITEEQIAKIKDVFSLLDMDGDNVVSIREYRTFYEQLGNNLTEADEKFDEADTDGNGSIDFNEAVVSTLNEAEEETKKTFDSIDKDG